MEKRWEVAKLQTCEEREDFKAVACDETEKQTTTKARDVEGMAKDNFLTIGVSEDLPKTAPG